MLLQSVVVIVKDKTLPSAGKNIGLGMILVANFQNGEQLTVTTSVQQDNAICL
jgi:hypothetical protein